MKIDRKRHGQQTNDLDSWATSAQKKLGKHTFDVVLEASSKGGLRHSGGMSFGSAHLR